MASSKETTPQPSQHVAATVHATGSRIHLTLAATPDQTQSSSASTVKFEPLDEPSSEVTFMATLSLQTQSCVTVESPAMVANGSKITLKEEKEKPSSSASSASAKAPDALEANSASTHSKSAMKQARDTTQNDEIRTVSICHEQLTPTTPVQSDSANNDREKPTKATAPSPQSQSAPKTPTKPISHEMDDLVSGFDDLYVDRSKSQRQSNKLSHIPSPHSVRVQDPSGRAIVYNNVHFPEAYISKIQSQKPDVVCSIQTTPSARSPPVSAEWNRSGSNEFDSDDETPVRYSVDRTMSAHSQRIHALCNSPSSKKVIVDHGNGVQLEYDNIHYPDRYMEKIRQNNPRAKCWVERS
ncbi:hypothetical protein HDU80_010203 [Chytriomyces hyalinus]|nr:hypothetical protein HDU80_010203 [Chytriomyces hyalinus]